MNIQDQIIEAFPEIEPTAYFRDLGIFLKDDGDGIVYVEKWEYSQPIPEGLSLGKPSA